jgi:peptidoglycan/xylan/chitin deacetylase (PgdA/CDA1 family)
MKDLAVKAHRLLQWVWAETLLATGCLWWARRQLRRRGAVVVLTFHRVVRESEYRKVHSLPGIIVLQRTFEQLAAHIAKKYEAVDLSMAEPGEPDDRLRVAVTFDDGWSDNYANALPIALAYGLPMAIFLCPGLADCNSPFWPEHVVALLRAAYPNATDEDIEAAIEKLKFSSPEESPSIADLAQARGSKRAPAEPRSPDSTLSWKEIAVMDQVGVVFGAHSHTHRILTGVADNAARWEVRESKAAIERALGKRCDLFAYPNGDWSSQTRRILNESGFRLAFTTQRGAWTADSDPLAIPRANVYEGNVVGPAGNFSTAMFEYTTFWKAWIASHRKRRPETQAQSVPTAEAARS